MASTSSGSGGRKGSPLKLPRLHLKAELLQDVPGLAALLATATDAGPPNRAAATQAAAQAAAAAGPLKPGSAQLGLSAYRDSRAARIFQDEERTEEDDLKEELAEVKAERANLLASLAALKRDTGKAGGELQQDDIAHLRRDLELKQQKLNELKHESDTSETGLQQLLLTAGDCTKLMPDGSPAEAARIAELREHLKALEVESAEAQAKHRLYDLLYERTRRDHGEMELKVRAAHEQGAWCAEDLKALTDAMHEERAAREEAERQLAAGRAVVDGLREDWQRKLRDRRKEVRDVEKRQEEEKAKAQDARAEEARLAAAAKEKLGRLRAAAEAKEAQVAALQPKLQALEAQWTQLQIPSGAATAEELIAYWNGLKQKIVTMKGLVEVVEQRQTQASTELEGLQLERSNLCTFPAETLEDWEPRVTPEQANTHAAALMVAKTRKADADKQFYRLRDMIVDAHQGLRALSKRLEKTEAGERRGSRASAGAPRPQLPAPPAEPTSPSRRGSRQQQPPQPAHAAADAAAALAEMVSESLHFLENIAARAPQLLEVEAAWVQSQAAGPGQEPPPPVNEMEQQLAFMKGLCRPLPGPSWLLGILNRDNPAAESKPDRMVSEDAPGQDVDQSNLWDSWSSDDDDESIAASGNESGADSEGEQDDLVVDREYIKHRAAKLVVKARLAAEKTKAAAGRAH